MKHLFILFFISGNIFSQKSKLNGIVVDAKSKDKLIGVNIAIENTSLGTNTDADGKYELELEAGEHTILFSYIGYDEKKITVRIKNNETQTLNTEITETENILNTVSISGGKFKKDKYQETLIWDLRAGYTFGNTNKYTFAFLVGNVLNNEYSLRSGIIESPRSYSFRLDLKF